MDADYPRFTPSLHVPNYIKTNIDSMCNSGVYTDSDGNIVYGTPIRIANDLLDVAHKYTQKQVYLYLNDHSAAKIKELKKHLPEDERNFKIATSVKDKDELLTTIGPQLCEHEHLHFFLLYDPYDASINWSVLIPFFRNWGEVMINHMVSHSKGNYAGQTGRCERKI